MSEAAAENAGGDGKAVDKPDAFEPINSQDDFEQRLGKRLERERAKFADYEDLRSKAAEFDKLEEAKKSEAEKQAETLAKVTGERDELQTQVLRLTHAKDLPADALDLVSGTTEAEIKASVERIQKLISNGGGPRTPKPDPAQGRGSGSTSSGDWLRDQLART